MYSLVILLTGCGFLALRRAVASPGPWNLAAVAIVTAALLYTQYWSLYLVGIIGIWLLVAAFRRRREGHRELAPWPAIGAVIVGCLLFIPWIPTFLYQSKHTGTPWSIPPNFSAVINAITGFTDNQGSNATSSDQGRLLAVVYFAMLALALFGIGKSPRVIELDLHTRPRARAMTFVVVGTLFAAIAGGIITSSAYSSRYASIVFLPLLLLVAFGTTTLLSPKARAIVVTIAVVAGLVGSVQNITTKRTQADQIAAELNAQAKPGDVIAFCPDQLGPAVARQLKDANQYTMLTFPRETGPAIVDWVDYADAVTAGKPAPFSQKVLSLAGPDHHVWLVWQGGYQTYGIKCETIDTDLTNAATQAGGGARNIVAGNGYKYYEPMSLTEYSPTAAASGS